MADHCGQHLHANVTGDGTGPISRSSVTHVAYIVNKFDDVKKDLVRQIGFGGILELPHITKVDRKFTLWLLSKIDESNRCIVVNGQCVADLVDFEVARIFGIPCGRKQVCSLDHGDKKKKVDFIQNFIGTEDMDCNSLIAAENNVTKVYEPPLHMSKKDMANFKVSFVVWVMGHLLAPSKKHNVGTDRFWGALLDPDEIKHFNWAEFVIDELLTAARDVQKCLNNYKTVSTITGCPILLQIIYFEAINMGSLNRPRGVKPRVKVYDGKSLNLMIAADKASSSTDSGNCTWGSNVRPMPQDMNIPQQKGNDNVYNDDGSAKHMIKDLGKYIRDNFGNKLSTSQSIAFNWFQARCTRHINEMRLNIQQDTVQLVSKLFGSQIAHPPNHVHVTEARPAQSEPSRLPRYLRSALKIKHGYENSSSSKEHQSLKKQKVSFRPEVSDEQSDSGSHLRTPSDLSGFLSQEDVPSFDLGLDFNDQQLNIGDNYIVGSPAQTQSPEIAGNENVLSSMGELSQREKFVMTSIVSISDSSNVSGSVKADKSEECPTPGFFAPLSGTPPSANSMQRPHLTTHQDIASLDLALQFSEEYRKGPNNVLGNPDQSDASHLPCNQNVSSHIPDKSQEVKIVCNVGNSSNNSASADDDISEESPTPGWFKALIGTPPSAQSMKRPLFTTPDERQKQFKTSPKSLSKILAEGDLVDRMTYLEDSPNINIKPWDEDYSDSPIRKRIIDVPIMPESPWTYNLSHRNPPSDIVDKFFEDVSMCSYVELNKPWVAHTLPRHIEMDGIWIHKCFITVSGLSYDVCDLAVRRLRQLDDIMYLQDPSLHWRHIMESEFAIFALAGEIPYNRKAIIEQFVGSSLCYKLENCRMIVVPAYILLNWCCYFFDFKEKCAHVIDPLWHKDQSNVFIEIHCPNVCKVAASIDNCLDMLFENWHPNLESWEIKFVEPTVADPTSAETGLLTLMYIRQFDGTRIQLGDREYFMHFKKLMLYELMCLCDNPVKPPVPLTISIED